MNIHICNKYCKTCVKWSLSKRPKLGFQDQLSLNAGQKYKCIAECSKHSAILSPSLSYHLSIRFLFCLFLSGRLRQVLLYGKYSKCSNRFLFFCPIINCWLSRLGSNKMLVRIANRIQDQKQSDLGLCYVSMPFFGRTTSV